MSPASIRRTGASLRTTWPTVIGALVSILAYGILALCAAALTACGGGDEDPIDCQQPDGKQHPLEPSLCICQTPGACK